MSLNAEKRKMIKMKSKKEEISKHLSTKVQKYKSFDIIFSETVLEKQTKVYLISAVLSLVTVSENKVDLCISAAEKLEKQ